MKGTKMRKVIASAILAGTIAIGSLFGAGSANADVTSGEICSRLNVSPTKNEILEISIEGISDGQSSSDMAVQFAIAAVSKCPTHKALITRVMDEFSNGDLS
jgi:hypothetical protein